MTTSRPQSFFRSIGVYQMIVAGAVVSTIPVGAYYYGRATGAPSASENAARSHVAAIDGERLARLEREVQRLRAATQQIQSDRLQEQQDVADRSVGRDDEERVSEEAPALTAEEQEALAKEQTEEFFHTLDARLASEAVEPVWRRQTEADITRVLPAQLGSNVQLEDVACAATICKVTLNHTDSPRISGDAFVRFLTNRDSLTAFEIQADNSREGTTSLYFIRQAETVAVGR